MLAKDALGADQLSLMCAGAIEAFRDHAVRDFPNECLGYVCPAGLYHPLVNVSPQPHQFAIADHRTLADLMRNEAIRALCHSHPNGPDCPSELDAQSQIELDLPFVIVAANATASAEPFCWGDGLIDHRPLIGRPFRHMTDDCYALIRAWWLAERGVLLPDFPRNWEWWLPQTEGAKDLYQRCFASAGFAEIDASDVCQGDVWLAAVRSDVPNHAGIVLEGGLTLHHPSSGLPCDQARLSKRDTLARWFPYVTHWLRRS
jgi:proteasome lid subunit RPN8/RPN11